MSDAPEIFADFAAAITQGAPCLAEMQAANHYDVNVGLAVYRNNYRGNLHDALAGAYPVIVQLVGAEFFRRLVRDFITASPSRSGNLFDYGAPLNIFLHDYAPTQRLAYLPDVAALEWACHRAYLADDASSLNLAELAAVHPEDYARLHLQLHPACFLIRSTHPVAAIWQAHQSTLAADFSLDLTQGGGALLLTRQHHKVVIETLAAADSDWLNAILAGQSLGAASEHALAHYADFNLPAVLLKLAQLDVLTGFYLGEQS
jgi:hypothetical protein